jgi:hypothetical protein
MKARSLTVLLACLATACQAAPPLPVDAGAVEAPSIPPKLAFPGPQTTLQWTPYTTTTSFTSPPAVKGYIVYAAPTDGGLSSCPLGVGSPGHDTITVTFGSPSTVTSSGTPSTCTLANGGSGVVYLGATF